MNEETKLDSLSQNLDWGGAVSYALTGQVVCSWLKPDPAEIAQLIRDCGFDGEKLAELKKTAEDNGEKWPISLPSSVGRKFGFSQLAALIRAVRAQLGLSGVYVEQKSRSTTIGADELRLMAELPPHFGKVG